MSDHFTYEELQKRVAQLQDKADKGEKFYESLFEHTHSIMLIIHPKSGKILDANVPACDFYGYTKNQITKMRIMNINTLSEEQVIQEMQKATRATRQLFHFRHRLSSGEIKDVEVFSGPIILHGKTVLYSIIYDISDRRKYEQEREDLIRRLEQALAEIKTLRGILPICATCKNIRDDQGYWNQIETYIGQHSDVEFTHGICPECVEKYYPGANISAVD